MVTRILSCVLGAAVLSSCAIPLVPHIERSQELTEENAQLLKGEEAVITLKDSRTAEMSIVAISSDSIILSAGDSIQHLPLANVKTILVEGSLWGRYGGMLIGAIVGGLVGGSIKTHGKTYCGFWGCEYEHPRNIFAGAMLGTIPGFLIGEFFFTPDWRYDVERGKSQELSNSQDLSSTRYAPRYVLQVERFLEETKSHVTILWQGRVVMLPKAQITIVKEEGGYRVTVPVALLQ